MKGRKRASVITPPPPELSLVDGAAGAGTGAIAKSITTDELLALKQLVRKGAPSVSPQERKAQRETARYSIRLSRPLLDRITRAAHDRPTHTPLNTWITEAILAQLKKEGL